MPPRPLPSLPLLFTLLAALPLGVDAVVTTFPASDDPFTLWAAFVVSIFIGWRFYMLDKEGPA